MKIARVEESDHQEVTFRYRWRINDKPEQSKRTQVAVRQIQAKNSKPENERANSPTAYKDRLKPMRITITQI